MTVRRWPALGDIYLSETWIFNGTDIKPKRRCVVVATIRPPAGRVTVYTRTTRMDVPGVLSGRDPSRGLTKPGVFAYLRHADWDDFVAHSQWLGTLDETTMTDIYDMFDGD